LLGVRARRSRDERGASAVELALVLPLLLLVVAAIVDYGMFFDNSLNVRQGVREAARQAVVEAAPTGTCASTEGGFLAQLGCTTRDRVGAIAGETYVRTFYTSWSRGSTLTVCSMVRTEGLTGLVPLPDHGYVRSRTDMSIEVTDPVPAGATSFQDTLPVGQDWSWCT
jgi:Flp pilus assembly protein TadG